MRHLTLNADMIMKMPSNKMSLDGVFLTAGVKTITNYDLLPPTTTNISTGHKLCVIIL